MSLLQKLKSALGLGGSRSRQGSERGGEVEVTVEHEPDATTEAAVKGSDGGRASESGEGNSDDTEERSIGEDEAAVAVEAAEEADAAADSDGGAEGVPVDELAGIGPAYADRLGDAGVETVADLAAADAATLAEESDVARSRLERWIEQAAEY